MKTSVLKPIAIALAVLVTNGLYIEPVMAAGCPAASFSAPTTFGAGTNPVSVAVGDFNGDGKADLAVANQQSDNVSVLLGNGDGTFQAAVNYSTGLFPQSVVSGDFNGDGKPDLAVANAF